MKYTFLRIFAVLIIFTGCAQTPDRNTTDAFFQELLTTTARTSTGVSMSVLAPNLEINWHGAVGYDSKEKEQALKASQPFRIASITKTFTAVAILRLVERGEIALDDPISKHISSLHKELLLKDGYAVNDITVQHCLQHTSGLFDYAVGSDAYILTALENPKKRWTRTEQIAFAMKHGEPLGAPGKQYEYSDTGYVLLGEIIERKTGKNLAAGYKALIDFNKLQLTSTWLETLEPQPEGLERQVRTYLEDTDATEWDNSIDLYGGGGYVSTTADLVKFYNGLFNGKIFENPETLQIMLAPKTLTNVGRNAEAYRMGIWEIKTPFGNGFMHDGFWDSSVIHFPSYNATIAINYVDAYTLDTMKGAFKEIVRRSKE